LIPVQVSVARGELGLAELSAPLSLDTLVPPLPETPSGGSPWEVEIGFGKGRYLLRRCLESPERRFLGIELVGEYQRLFVDRARRRIPASIANWVALRGEAQYLASAVLPAGFADVLHIYFPDPWPKIRHHKRRLFDPESVDLVLGLLRPGGRLCFATDFLEYGELVVELLQGYPGLRIARRERPWDDGARTNYEAKYEVEGRPILRLEGVLEVEGRAPLHPLGVTGVVVGPGEAGPSQDDEGRADL
jgi:tRNA (guanine-N7-)-methyltransferase